MDSLVCKVQAQVKETYDKFIFETINPFVKDRIRTVIDKQFLIDAIERHSPMKIIKGEGKGVFYLDRCPRCYKTIVSDFEYCPKCGQRLEREEAE